MLWYPHCDCVPIMEGQVTITLPENHERMLVGVRDCLSKVECANCGKVLKPIYTVARPCPETGEMKLWTLPIR